MAEVVPFARPEREDPHWAGEAVCIGCRHEWVAVAPIGVVGLDCPACELPKGIPKHPFGANEGDSLFLCNCGCEALTAYYHAGRFYMRCMACGTDQTSAIFGE